MGVKGKQKVDRRQHATTLDLRGLKKFLRRGDIEGAAKEVGITREHASSCMNGKKINWQFAENIIQRAERNKQLKERAERI